MFKPPHLPRQGDYSYCWVSVNTLQAGWELTQNEIILYTFLLQGVANTLQGVIIIYVSLMNKLRCDCLTPLPEITQHTDDETTSKILAF